MPLHPAFIDHDHLRHVLYQHFKQQLAQNSPAEPCSMAEDELRQFCERKPQLTANDMHMLWEFWVEMAYLEEEPLASMTQAYVYILDHQHGGQLNWQDMSDDSVKQALSQALSSAQSSNASPSLSDRSNVFMSSPASRSALSTSLNSVSNWIINSADSTPPNHRTDSGQESVSPMTLPRPAAHYLQANTIMLPDNVRVKII